MTLDNPRLLCRYGNTRNYITINCSKCRGEKCQRDKNSHPLRYLILFITIMLNIWSRIFQQKLLHLIQKIITFVHKKFSYFYFNRLVLCFLVVRFVKRCFMIIVVSIGSIYGNMWYSLWVRIIFWRFGLLWLRMIRIFFRVSLVVLGFRGRCRVFLSTSLFWRICFFLGWGIGCLGIFSICCGNFCIRCLNGYRLTSKTDLYRFQY